MGRGGDIYRRLTGREIDKSKIYARAVAYTLPGQLLCGDTNIQRARAVRASAVLLTDDLACAQPVQRYGTALRPPLGLPAC